MVLAGGDGARLRDLTGRITGTPRPKQFCSFFGGQTLMAGTRARIENLFPDDRTLFALTRSHEAYYREELRGVDASRTVIQPSNRGTAIAMALCLETVVERDPDAVVAFFPSDHHYRNAAAFHTVVDAAMRAAEQYPEFVVMLGAKPTYPEVEYGWIEPGRMLVESPVNSLHRVSQFWEKPELRQAEKLLRAGCLWNTFVTTGLASAFLELLHATAPQLAGLASLNDRQLENTYQTMPSVDFSRAVSASAPQRLLVMEDADSGWTDLGSPRRIVDIARTALVAPAWLSAYSAAGADLAHST